MKIKKPLIRLATSAKRLEFVSLSWTKATGDNEGEINESDVEEEEEEEKAVHVVVKPPSNKEILEVLKYEESCISPRH